ncbi:ABC superfamily ATP binding cassette transporter, membrane protein [Companilactobacillus tucceti DSM 20183]|uniref:ABC superfamily ATP binding cassette transporter, membrane protein n=1 Tax=Companilactobacillus tucceti DSM 20183 TaxID=1423811 RepID=A0A0R1IZR0_9LACO|nr:ABC transporter permease [Companilactobacillus tucceti]KRK64797.1 ABC superfamily ATP binding cassette transporter, membrane protein [Companilactobacillus tucceti DSM 20183]
MAFSFYQEFYKLCHRKLAWIAPLTLLILMILTDLSIGYNESKLLMATCYNAPDWIMLILVVVGATTFSMEFQNNAILTLLYKSPSKALVYLSKYIVILIYNLWLHLIAMLFTFGLHETSLNQSVSWSTLYRYQQPLWENMLKTSAIDVLTTTFIISLIFLLSCLINSNSIVISVSLLMVFMGQFISDNLLNSEKFTQILRWNPFNMTNLTRQYYNYATYFDTSHLLNQQLLLGTLSYTLLFVIVGYLIFRKKRF